MYSPKYYLCSAKKWAQGNCKYSLEDLKRCVPQALGSITNYTILAYYHRCGRKIDLYREGITYGSFFWIARTAHHKPTNTGDNQ